MAEINKKFEETYKKFELVKQQIEEESSLIPVTFQTTSGERTITKESLDEEFENLKKSPFTVAVCGEVKAGKSTLLNSILFGDNVLPTFDTPLTAKLTFIKKTDKPYNYFKVNFYSKGEWNLIEKSQDLQDNMKLAAERFGVYDVNCIEDVSKSEEITDLQELEQYVSAINKNDNSSLAGKYTSYVKNVEIFINNENLPENLQVVDTPGLNDPNAINSVETTNWINNAHAIVYVVEWKGFADPDLKFFQQFMANRGPKYRIIVQNKIDDNKDYKDSLLYMKGLGQKLEYRKINLFSPAETVCSYSGLQMLISKKEAQGFPLTEDEEYYKSDDYDYNPDKLEDKISDKLFKNEGAGRIEAVANSLNQVYEVNIDRILNEMEDCKSQIEDYEKDKGELEENRIKIQDNRLEFNNKIKEKEEELQVEHFKIDAAGKIRVQLNESQEKILEKFKNEINDLMDLGNYVTVVSNFETTWNCQLNSCIENLRALLNRNIKVFVEKLNEIARDLEGDVKHLLNKKHVGRFYGKLQEDWDLPGNVQKMLDYKDVLPKNFFTNLFHRNKTLKAEIYKEVQNCLTSFFSEKLSGLPGMLKDALDDRNRAFNEDLKQKLQDLENQIANIEKKYDDREAEVCKLNECIDKLRLDKDQLEQKVKMLNTLKTEVMA
ncbi:dynamin family protein [Candidatus Saccharibacteria bacterium]|nr:dynamin family protein [Candidatus Saccharibacteria bacterium]